jgi:hypothetical protein
MTDERALLTDREREILKGEADVSDNYRYKVESTARKRIQSLQKDAEVLRENYPDIYEKLQKAVSGE